MNEIPEVQPPPSPYAVLGLDPQASAEEVRRAYFRLVRLHPPETHPEDFRRVRAAYDALRSPMRRAELALESFDESVTEIDLDLLEGLGGPPVAGDLDAAAILLAVELSASDLARTAFPEDLTAISAESWGLPTRGSEPRPGAPSTQPDARNGQ